ncbi:hypothetical protein [Paenibacillus sp. PL91]|uniref:hypothetical protein n=1 Tax=Paenibacillus sp. PL91 TaxID=2729538 RepID=UPI00145CBD36|nr:hypothetical protein [Paenibacillus sp. PL91]MBC9198907.1 hypothetical protein [Paenibacillus sp. PL91]
MEKKRCLFCSEIVPIEAKGEHDHYLGCYCAPDGGYSLLRENYNAINSISYQKKSKQFPVLSAYIREQSDCGELVRLSGDDIESIVNSPKIPVTVEEKAGRLLQYLYRRSDGPLEPVVIHPLSQNYNLTYSPNLQELVYIIETLREEQLVVREGMTFKLTEKGWSEAAARAGGRRLKSCFVLLPEDSALRSEWLENIFPRVEQCGYLPRLFVQSDQDNREHHSISNISDSKLIIADLTNQSAEVYFAAGYALGKNIPIIWTVSRSGVDDQLVQAHPIRPFVWDTTEELASMLQQRLSYRGTAAM